MKAASSQNSQNCKLGWQNNHTTKGTACHWPQEELIWSSSDPWTSRRVCVCIINYSNYMIHDTMIAWWYMRCSLIMFNSIFPYTHMTFDFLTNDMLICLWSKSCPSVRVSLMKHVWRHTYKTLGQGFSSRIQTPSLLIIGLTWFWTTDYWCIVPILFIDFCILIFIYLETDLIWISEWSLYFGWSVITITANIRSKFVILVILLILGAELLSKNILMIWCLNNISFIQRKYDCHWTMEPFCWQSQAFTAYRGIGLFPYSYQ